MEPVTEQAIQLFVLLYQLQVNEADGEEEERDSEQSYLIIPDPYRSCLKTTAFHYICTIHTHRWLTAEGKESGGEGEERGGGDSWQEFYKVMVALSPWPGGVVIGKVLLPGYLIDGQCLDGVPEEAEVLEPLQPSWQRIQSNEETSKQLQGAQD